MDKQAEETRQLEEARAEACASHDIYEDMVKHQPDDVESAWAITMDLITHPELMQSETYDQYQFE